MNISALQSADRSHLENRLFVPDFRKSRGGDRKNVGRLGHLGRLGRLDSVWMSCLLRFRAKANGPPLARRTASR